MRRAVALALAAALASAAPARTQQLADTTFAPRAERPAFTKRHPVVFVDEAHYEYHTMAGRYRALAGLLASDGCRVVPGTQPFSPELLRGCQVLVVADALGAARMADANAVKPAFTDGECDVVRDWVKDGGALLLVADHAPFAVAMEPLARRFGVDMSKAYTIDDRNADPESGNPGCILFAREKRGLADHPILRGRDAGDRVSRVATFTGQSLKGPPGSVNLLALAPSAVDLPLTPAGQRVVAGPKPAGSAKNVEEMPARDAVPAKGRAQAVAFAFGRGRVVVAGDAAMFGAQLAVGREAIRVNREVLHLGMNRSDLDNQKLALNIVRWLAGALD